MKNLKTVKSIFITGAFILLMSLNGFAQELSVTRSSEVSIDKLPEYVIVTSENTKLLGGINITIDVKRSIYKENLRNLEGILQDGDKLRVRNQTDLLNSMSTLGYDYINAYSASGGTLGGSYGNKAEVSASDTKFRTNMVFRKKEAFRL